MVPHMLKSQDDFIKLENLGASTTQGMIMTLIIPLGFMLIFSISMNKVWSVYNTA